MSEQKTSNICEFVFGSRCFYLQSDTKFSCVLLDFQIKKKKVYWETFNLFFDWSIQALIAHWIGAWIFPQT